MENTNGSGRILLEVKDLKKYFPVKRGIFRRTVAHVKAVDGVSFFIREGETLGLVGESGCGKTTTGRVILKLIEPTSGQVVLSRDGQMIDLARLRPRQLKPLRREMQIIFQDPYSSLNPRMTIGDIIAEPLVVHSVARGKER
ncbi:ATP-binding cassette domain-containing protein, partial [Candidatus Acetothermia bacterium]|nr:ATP-binding cassette domain-containing protein [Candidatus Acetothermia bacterium]